MLQIQSAPDGMVLSWPICPEGCVLEESNELGGSGKWTRVEALGEIVGNVRRVLLPRSGDRRFFRLLRL